VRGVREPVKKRPPAKGAKTGGNQPQGGSNATQRIPMKIVRGKRQFRQERVYGMVIVSEPVAKVRTVALVFGHRAFGVQWKWTPKKRR
jgi:hypothetical protein